jgi:hypothetical protein
MLSIACATTLQAQSAGTGTGGTGGASGGSSGGTTGGSGAGTSAGRTGGTGTSTGARTPGSTSGTPSATGARPASGTSTANDGLGTSTRSGSATSGTPTSTTSPTGTGTGVGPNANTGTGTNINRGTNTGAATGTSGANTTGTGVGTTVGAPGTGTDATTPNASRTSGTSPNTFGPNGVTTSGSAGALNSLAGTITAFGVGDFAVTGAGGAAPANFQFTPDTVFTDANGNVLPRDRFFRRGNAVPATVFFSNVAANGNPVASRVVLNEAVTTNEIEQAGTITEVSPGILVIEQPGASDTPVRFVNNTTTNYVNELGEPVPPESVKAGTPVRIFYTKVGDTLVASRVEVTSKNKSGLPKPPLSEVQSTTRKTTTTTREEK